MVIVFITAAPQYAINGYEVQALSYLLKPVPYFAFRQELKRSIDMVRRRGSESLLIEAGGRQMRVELADVLYLESIRHTIIVHTLSGKLSVVRHAQGFRGATSRSGLLPFQLLLSGESAACGGRRGAGLRDVERGAAAGEPAAQEGVPDRAGELHGRGVMSTSHQPMQLPDIPRLYTGIVPQWLA